MNFLTAHPRTLQWWEERETCLRCKHMHARTMKYTGQTSRSGGGMFCMLTKTACIDSRDKQCGPSAKLFEAKA